MIVWHVRCRYSGLHAHADQNFARFFLAGIGLLHSSQGATPATTQKAEMQCALPVPNKILSQQSEVLSRICMEPHSFHSS
jgi:hypothetical protein